MIPKLTHNTADELFILYSRDSQSGTMADLEKVLANVGYLIAIDKSKASKKILLPDPSVRSVMWRHMSKTGDIAFDSIFDQQIGFKLFKDFCNESSGDAKKHMHFYEDIRLYTGLASLTER